jgi:hypothetical protein
MSTQKIGLMIPLVAIGLIKKRVQKASKIQQIIFTMYKAVQIYACISRATCWRHDIPKDQRKSPTTTSHGWFVWERGHPTGTLLGSIRKQEKSQ